MKHKSKEMSDSMHKSMIAEDKKIVKKAVNMHDAQLHKGKQTNLKSLKSGGMVKSSCRKG